MAAFKGEDEFAVPVDAVTGAAQPTVGTTVLANTEETAELAGVDIFAADAAPARAGVVNIEFITNTAGVLSLKLLRNSVERVGEANDLVSIPANAWKVFQFPVRASDALNLRFSVNATVTAMISFQDKT